jgi:hypothetical protein
MPLKKIQFRSGVSRENTRYTSESVGPPGTASANYTGGWYEVNKVRFRSGFPEKIGGWAPESLNTFMGVCRSLWNWATLGGSKLFGLGTNLKFYIFRGGLYFDITPIRGTATLIDPFAATDGSNVITVTSVDHGCITGDFVTFSNATSLGGNVTAEVLNQEYQVTVLTADTYTIQVAVTANALDVGAGGTVDAEYQINTGPETQQPTVGWGAGLWGYGEWGIGDPVAGGLRVWSQTNFGENLLFAPRGGGIYFWKAADGVATRGVNIADLAGADSDTPVIQNLIFVSDSSRFTFAFGCNDYSSAQQEPMLIRWSDQESLITWTPDATNQAGSVRLSHGSEIVAAIQARQEIVVLTDAAVYSMQYVGAPTIWQTQLLGDNISILSQNAVSLASGVVYWMGVDKFYKYDGRVQTLRCDLRQFIYSDINLQQNQQVFSGTNEGFNEVWWFYCSENSTSVDKYVVYNYLEDIWYYGTMSRTSWLDSGISSYPMATTYNTDDQTGRMLNHEYGVDDNTDGTPVGMEALIASSEFDIQDGHNFGFIWRMLPDITFRGSTGDLVPQVTMSLIPLANSGSGYNNPLSEGGTNTATVQRITRVPVEEFTGQVFIRVRGRQLVFKVESSQLGTAWQIGSPRIDIQSDGRRGNA